MMRPTRLLPLLAASLLAACSHPPPPPASAQADPAQATELRDTIQKPIARAKGVEDIIEKSHQHENGQIDAAEGAAASSPASPP
jgi:hypothetical protein